MGKGGYWTAKAKITEYQLSSGRRNATRIATGVEQTAVGPDEGAVDSDGWSGLQNSKTGSRSSLDHHLGGPVVKREYFEVGRAAQTESAVEPVRKNIEQGHWVSIWVPEENQEALMAPLEVKLGLTTTSGRVEAQPQQQE